VSYLDTLEIVAFLAQHPSLRPAPLQDLVSEYHLAWVWLSHDYKPDTHMLSVFAPGRGNYAYISKEREWQQTVGFFGKAIMAEDNLMKVLTAEKVDSFPAHPTYPKVARFEFFRHGDRPSGVWIVRQGQMRFALPFTTGTKPGVADYLPAPHGLPGFSVPVEQVFPAGASQFEMPDGQVLIAGDSADEIVPAADGLSVRATWRRFVVKGGKTGAWIEPGFEVTNTWSLSGSTLKRVETIKALKDLSIRKVRFVLPSTGKTVGPTRLVSSEGDLEVSQSGDLAMALSAQTPSPEDPLGRGARGAIATHLIYEAQDLQLKASQSKHWDLSIQASAPTQRNPR
jgi:hypothetical protein